MEPVARGDIWLARLDPTVGHEIKKTRPVVILQNDIGNTYGATTIVAAITSQQLGHLRATDVLLPSGRSTGLRVPSKVLLSQLRTIDKRRLIERLGHVTESEQAAIEQAVTVSLGLRH